LKLDLGPSMTRISRCARAIAGVSVVGTAIAVVSLSTLNGADRLVDASYDRAIAVADSVSLMAAEPAYLHRVRQDRVSSPAVPSARSQAAATEHVWLTRSQHVDAVIEPAADASATTPAVIGTSVGARFSVASGGHSQILEVVDVRQISDDHLPSPALVARDPSSKSLLISCKVVAIDGKTAAASGARLVRFVVDADGHDATTPARFPRVL
jgi:hypothetical protein